MALDGYSSTGGQGGGGNPPLDPVQAILDITGDPLDESALIQEAMERYNNALGRDKENRDAGFEDVQFLAGNQWNARDAAERARDGRPTLTLNRLPGFQKQVTGEIRRNPPSISVSAADGAATTDNAEVLEGIIRSIERFSHGRQLYAQCADNQTGYGAGHLQIAIQWADQKGFDLELRIRGIPNPLAVVWDEQTQEPDKGDARYCFVTSDVDKKSFDLAYPQAGASGWTKALPFSKQVMPYRGGGPVVTVVEYWKVHTETFKLVHMQHKYGGVQDGTFVPASGAETVLQNPDEQTLAEAGRQGFSKVQERDAERKRVCMYLLCSQKLLTKPIEWPGSRIPVFTAVGEEKILGDVVIRHGMVRFAKDAQMMLNYAASSDLEAHGLSPKAPYIISDKQLEGYEDEWAVANKRPVPYIRYKEVPGVAKPSREPPIATNPGFMAMAAAAGDYMKETTGIYDASLGQHSNETSGVAIEARDQQADTGSFVYIDNIRSMLESLGQELVFLIPRVMSARQEVLILGKDDTQRVVNFNRDGIDLNIGRYTAIAGIGPAFQTRRQEAVKTMTDLAKISPPQFIPALIIRIAKAQDWENADELAEELTQIAISIGLLPHPGGAPGAPGAGGPALPGVPAPPNGAAPPGPGPAGPLPPPGAPPAPGGAPRPPMTPALQAVLARIQAAGGPSPAGPSALPPPRAGQGAPPVPMGVHR